MNRQQLESLIEFALHLERRVNSYHTGNVAKDALELSRLAKRLHYLDERYAQLDPDIFPDYFQKADAVLTRATLLLASYGYLAYREHNEHGEPVYGAKLYAVPVRPSGHDLAVPC